MEGSEMVGYRRPPRTGRRPGGKMNPELRRVVRGRKGIEERGGVRGSVC